MEINFTDLELYRRLVKELESLIDIKDDEISNLKALVEYQKNIISIFKKSQQ